MLAGPDHSEDSFEPVKNLKKKVDLLMKLFQVKNVGTELVVEARPQLHRSKNQVCW